MLHPHTELKKVSPEIGYGVYATLPIPKGTVTWALDPLDQILAPRRLEELGARYREKVERYTWLNRAGSRILCWDFARFMNHACDANTMAAGGFDFEIAIRDIATGDQVTSDYGTLNLERAFSCECGSADCRRTVRPEDFEQLALGWDLLVREAFPLIGGVRQPLWPYVQDKRAVWRGVGRPEAIPSILQHRFVAGATVSGWPARVTAY